MSLVRTKMAWNIYVVLENHLNSMPEEAQPAKSFAIYWNTVLQKATDFSAHLSNNQTCLHGGLTGATHALPRICHVFTRIYAEVRMTIPKLQFEKMDNSSSILSCSVEKWIFQQVALQQRCFPRGLL
jgi:hypothetical protein